MGRLIPFGITAFGLYWAYLGWFEYGFWANNGPGGGFLAVIAGLMCALLSIAEIVRNVKSSAFKLERKHFYPVIACVVLFGVIKVFGMIVSLGLFIVVWLVFLEQYPVTKAAVMGVSTIGVLYLVFKFFLHVPFPVGYLGI